MRTQIELLVGMQTIDQQLRERTDAIDSLRRRIAELEIELEEQRKTLDIARGEREAHETRRRDLEGTLAVEESRMKDRRMRLQRIRNEKEASALRRELDAGREIINQLEEDLLGCMETLEKVEAREQELQTAYDTLVARHATDAPQAASDIAELSSGLDEAKRRRDELAQTVDARLRRQYEMIFGRRRGLVVVEVRDGNCQGCHMRVAPQLFNDLRRSEQVILCPSCHRILYWRPEPAASEA